MQKRLHICYITGAGAHDWALQTPRRLAERGHQLVLICPESTPMAQLAQASGLTVRPFRFPTHLRDIRGIVGTVMALWRLFRTEQPDVAIYYMLPISAW